MSFSNLIPQNVDHFSDRAKHYLAQTFDLSKKAFDPARAVIDIAYGPDPKHQLDVFTPPAGSGTDLPVMIFLHGGGWSSGYKEQMGFMAPAINALPAIFVSAAYRLIPDHRFPTALEDTVAAIKWVYDNIAQYGGSPDKISIGGHSAGGHLAAMATLRRDLLTQQGLPADVIKNCLPVSSTFRFEIGQFEAMGKQMLQHPEDAGSASPINFVAGNTTAFHIIWGSDDLDRVSDTSLEMVAALAKEGSPVTHQEFAGYDHFDTNLSLIDPAHPWVRTAHAMLAS